jgi:ElaB/YqjD/DUF883 family membrane-anchored ribosome-binding protein
MHNNIDQLTTDLQRVAEQIESLLKTAGIAERAEEAGRKIQAGVTAARERVSGVAKGVEDEIVRRGRETGEFVQANPWLAAGIAAAVGFIAGAIVARRQ